MPDWVANLLEPTTLFVVGSVIFIIYMLCWSFVKAYPFIVKTSNVLNTLVGNDEKPSLEKRLISHDAKLDKIISSQEEDRMEIQKIKHEVLPNHGSSLNDAVRRTEKRLDDHLNDFLEYQPFLKSLYKDFNKKEEV